MIYGWTQILQEGAVGFAAKVTERDFRKILNWTLVATRPRTRVFDHKSTSGNFILQNTGKVERNSSYAIIPETVGRPSASAGYDPWYTTVSDASSGELVIDNRRPVLSCWKDDAWTYGRYTAKNIEDLNNLNLPTIIGEEILQFRMAYPMIIDVAAGLGNSIFVSSTTGLLDGTVDAATSTYADDFDCLIFALYVATQNILRDTAMITNKYNLQNAALDDFGIPKPGTGNFVLTSGEVQSLSFNTLIAVLVIFIILWLVQATLGLFLDNSKTPTMHMLRFTSRAVAFQPIQMYRFIDEQVCGYRGDWTEDRTEMPYIKEASLVKNGDEQKPAADKQKPGVGINEVEIGREVAPQTPAANIQLPVYASPRVIPSGAGEKRLVFDGPRAPAELRVTAASKATDEKTTGMINERQQTEAKSWWAFWRREGGSE